MPNESYGKGIATDPVDNGSPSQSVTAEPPPNNPHSPPTQEVTEKATETDVRQLEDRFKRREWWIIGPTVAIAFWGLFNVVVGGLQWYTMKGQLGVMENGRVDTHALVKAAKNLADAAEAQSDKFDKLISQATAQATATNNLAKEAKRSADAANQSLEEIRANFSRDQRPWVFINNFTLSSEPEENKPITIKCTLINTGKTPADIVHKSNPSIWKPEPPMTNFVINGFTSRMILPPGAGITGTTFSFETIPWIVPKQDIDVYTKKTSMLYLHAELRYWDTGRRPHWTTVCAFHQFGWPPSHWQFCASGNTVDPDAQQNKKPN